MICCGTGNFSLKQILLNFAYGVRTARYYSGLIPERDTIRKTIQLTFLFSIHGQQNIFIPGSFFHLVMWNRKFSGAIPFQGRSVGRELSSVRAAGVLR